MGITTNSGKTFERSGLEKTIARNPKITLRIVGTMRSVRRSKLSKHLNKRHDRSNGCEKEIDLLNLLPF